MEMQQFDQSQTLGNMEQSFGAGGQNQINHNMDSAIEKTELPEPGEGEKENDGVVNPEIPDEGDPTPTEKPIIY